MSTYRKHYDTLGVKPDASQDEIKRVFRSKAKDCHPDHHPGDKAKEGAFKELSGAYAILSDPDARARYDETGEAPEADNTMAQAYGVIIQTFQKIRHQKGDDIFFLDPIERLKKFFHDSTAEAKAEIERIAAENKRIDKLLKKVIHKKGNQQSFLHVALAEERKQNELQIANIEHAIAVMSQALAVLDEYRFDADKRPEPKRQDNFGLLKFYFDPEAFAGFDTDSFPWIRKAR